MRVIADLETRWNEEGRHQPIHAVMSLEPDGLVLGAGTLLAKLDRNKTGSYELDPDTDPIRLLTLLSVAYERPVPPSVFRNIANAARQRERGNDCLAGIHLALTGLPKLDAPREAARRLFIADRLLTHGITPATLLKALEIDPGGVEALQKYDPDEPRVPQGDGPESGRWTAGNDSDGHSYLKDLPKSALPALAGFLSRLPGAEVAVTAAEVAGEVAGGAALAATSTVLGVGLMLIPRTTGNHVTGPVEGAPGCSFDYYGDTTTLRIVHTNGSGQIVTLEAEPDRDGLYRDAQGRVIARMTDYGLIVDTAMLREWAQTANDNDPRLCPKPVKDREGRNVGGKETAQSKRDRAYEDYVKNLVNPGNPTPSGFAYAFWNPSRHATVFFDDCQQTTGSLHEFKGSYGKLIELFGDSGNFNEQWVKQASRQIEASQGRAIVWHFADEVAADKARQLFHSDDDSPLKRIRVEWTPWIGPRQ